MANMGLDKRSPGSGNAVDTIRAGNDLKRDVKVVVSIPVIIASGVGLGILLMGIFVLEAFVSEVYDGVGKQVVVSSFSD